MLQSKPVARKQGHCAEKASAQLFRIADFGFRIFLVFFFNPHSANGIPQFGGGPLGQCKFGIRNKTLYSIFFHSAFRIPHSAFWLPARSKKGGGPHDFCAQRPCFRAGQCLKFNGARAYLPKREGVRFAEYGVLQTG
jgi:hypothetical protein